MIKKTIKFFDNHNGKLNCAYFTTIRPEWDYYKNSEEYSILLRGKVHCSGKIIGIRRFDLKDLNDYIAFLDYGKSAKQLTNLILSMYPKKDFQKEKLFLLLIKNLDF